MSNYLFKTQCYDSPLWKAFEILLFW